MSLTGALYNAFSGLRANSQAAALVATNISNATTESYGRRELSLTPGVSGGHGGVRVHGVVRHSDPVLLSERRVSDAALARSDDLHAFARLMETEIGIPGEPGGLADRVTAFENALLSAAANPSSAQRLESVAYAAQSLALALNTASDRVQEARLAADGRIADQVCQLNSDLARIEQLNEDIVTARVTGVDTATFQDERQRLIDGISGIVPLRVVSRDQGAVALFTTGGAVLLDGSRAEIGFAPVNDMAAGLSQADGDLSGLTLNDIALTNGERTLFAGGSLAAQFEIRDEAGVAQQAMLDGLARDLAERLGPGGPDSTLATGDAGLFTDAGLAVEAVNQTGLAGRIAVNTLVAPGSAELWRLRDGLGAAAPGEVGDGSLLQGLSAALARPDVPGASALGGVARSFSDLGAYVAAQASGDRVRAENDQSYRAAQNTALKELELSTGVDTDAELQRLMQIEQHYAANAQVMSVIDDLMERLMAI